MEPFLKSAKSIQIVGVNSGLIDSAPLAGSFAEYLTQNGHRISAVSGAPDVEILFCMDFNSSIGRAVRRSKVATNRRILVQMEPPVVLPQNYLKSTQSLFGKVLRIGGYQADSYIIPWPQTYPRDTVLRENFSSKKSNRFVLVNGNKLSLIAGEMYALRRKVVLASPELDLYGTDWDSNFLVRVKHVIGQLIIAIRGRRLPRIEALNSWFENYPNYFGSTPDKIKTMSNYKFALVIENSVDYMSEKLMDALFAGCIPVYVGPKVNSYGIPVDLVIQAEPNLKAVLSAMELAKGMDYQTFRSKALKYLLAESTKTYWTANAVHRVILGRAAA